MSLIDKTCSTKPLFFSRFLRVSNEVELIALIAFFLSKGFLSPAIEPINSIIFLKTLNVSFSKSSYLINLIGKTLLFFQD